MVATKKSEWHWEITGFHPKKVFEAVIKLNELTAPGKVAMGEDRVRRADREQDEWSCAGITCTWRDQSQAGYVIDVWADGDRVHVRPHSSGILPKELEKVVRWLDNRAAES